MLLSTLLLIIQIAGIALAVRAVMIARTPQAAMGWAIALILLPIVAIPFFLVFGESKFSGYVLAGTEKQPLLDKKLQEILQEVAPHATTVSGIGAQAASTAQRVRCLPPLRGNSLRLLRNGDETFPAIFEAIDAAHTYLLIQFYIYNDDALGRELLEHLRRAVARGVKVWLLFDSVGAKKMTPELLQDMKTAGIIVEPFVTNRQHGKHFQINFRNHRKLVVADGRVAFLGGLNVGDEYMGRDPKFGFWRDTHLRIEGPAAKALEVSFIEDWNYVRHEVLTLPPGEHQVNEKGAPVFLITPGPADPLSVCSAVLLELLYASKERLWIASPYLVPDPALRHALIHAGLRGVDVRILLPKNPDHLLPWLSSFSFYPALRRAGVRVFRYQNGFMHQKVILADQEIAVVGSINMDFRSFMLNFELSAATSCREFAAEVEHMLKKDMEDSAEEDLTSFENGSFWFRLKVKLAALTSPEQ